MVIIQYLHSNRNFSSIIARSNCVALMNDECINLHANPPVCISWSFLFVPANFLSCGGNVISINGYGVGVLVGLVVFWVFPKGDTPHLGSLDLIDHDVVLLVLLPYLLVKICVKFVLGFIMTRSILGKNIFCMEWRRFEYLDYIGYIGILFFFLWISGYILHETMVVYALSWAWLQ